MIQKTFLILFAFIYFLTGLFGFKAYATTSPDLVQPETGDTCIQKWFSTYQDKYECRKENNVNAITAEVVFSPSIELIDCSLSSLSVPSFFCLANRYDNSMHSTDPPWEIRESVWHSAQDLVAHTIFLLL